jgi:ankyrin repeat protein
VGNRVGVRFTALDLYVGFVRPADSWKVEVNSKNRDGRTPLSYAAESRHEAVVKLLLKTSKVKVDSKDRPTVSGPSNPSSNAKPNRVSAGLL